jgi:glycosyltransferase involved in cell wall biosynthesis
MRPLTVPRLLMTTDAVGGVWRYALDLCATLVAQGAAAPTLVGSGPRPSASQRAEAEAAAIPLLWIDEALDWQACDDAALARTGAALSHLARRHRPDLLHLNGAALGPFIDDRTPRLIAVHSCLATWWDAVKGGPLPAEWRWHRDVTARGLARADIVVAPSAAFAAALRVVYGPLPSLRVVSNGTDPIQPVAKESFVLAAGRWWDEAKNMACLVEAAALASIAVHAAGPRPTDGDRAAATPAVRWLGELPYAELRHWHARASIFASLSLYEPFGLAVLEAASAGAALSLSAIPTFLELWEGCALFVDPRCPAEVAAAFDRLATDGSLRSHLAHAARARAQGLTLAHQAEAMRDVWAPLVAPPRLAG